MTPDTEDPSEPDSPEVFRKPHKSDYNYRFTFYDREDVQNALDRGWRAWQELKARDLWLLHKTRELNVPLIYPNKGKPKPRLPPRPGERTRIGDWSIVDPGAFERTPIDQILTELATMRERRRADLAARRSVEKETRQRARESMTWHRPKDLVERYEVIDGRLHERRYRVTLEGERIFETSPYPINSTSIRYEGERLSVPWVTAWVANGVPQAVRRGRTTGPKRPRFKAQLRVGRVVHHLGMFDTAEDRDHAVRVAKVNVMLTGQLPPKVRG